MNKNAAIISVIVIVAIVLLGAWWVMSQNQPSTNTENEAQNENLVVDIVDISQKHTITYTDSGYSPANLTIKKGDTIEFKNQSSIGMWPASAMHPTHTVYGGMNLQTHCPDNENDDLDACGSIATGQSWEFTFNKTGAWGYHDHLTASNFGKIVVE